MIAEFRLPDLGEGLPEAELVQWLVAPGDTVALNQPIAEVETAKAVVELPSPFEGTVARLHADVGEAIAVGAPVISVETGSGETDPVETSSGDADPGKAGSGSDAGPNLVGYGAAPQREARPRRRARRGGERPHADADVLEAAPHDAVASPVVDDTRHERPRSTPPVRKLARDLGVDLALVEAAGATGVITRADVEAFAARASESGAGRGAAAGSSPVPDGSADRDVPAGERVVRVPIRGVRKHTAEAMVRSAFTAPHVTTFLDVDVTATVELVDALRADRRWAPHRIGVTAVVAKAVCLALSRHPDLNARWDEQAGVIEQYRYVNLGMAAATERGLVVPNVKDAERLGLAELADAIAAVAGEARDGRPRRESLTGGTFSITNFGVFGIDAGTPILNPGEAGILGVGAVRRRPWEYRGELALRDVMTLSLSFDHRLVDGEQAARFLVDVGDVLREPGRAMLLG